MPRVKTFNENEVLIKAMNLFWKQGYAATSVQDLVSHLGINRASLYDTFGDKEKLFYQSIELYKKTNTAGIGRFFEREKDVKKGFKKLFQMAIDQAINDKENKGCFVVNTTTELIPGDEKISEIVADNKKIFEELFYQYLLRGKEEGQLTTDQDLQSIASLLFTIYNGLRVVSKIQPNKKELDNSINLVVSLLD